MSAELAADLRASVSDYRNPLTTEAERETIRLFWAEHGILNQFAAMLRAADLTRVSAAGPFEPIEADVTTLRSVLRDVFTRGLELGSDDDEIASVILHSRWCAATKHFAQLEWFAPGLAEITPNPERTWDSSSQAPPFHDWDSDHRSLVSAVWASKREETPDVVERMVQKIYASRWYAAVVAENRNQADAA